MEDLEKNLFIQIDTSEENEIKRKLYLILEALVKCQSSIEEIKEINNQKNLGLKKINEKFLNIKQKFYNINSALPKSKEKVEKTQIEKEKIEKKKEIRKGKRKKGKEKKMKKKKIALMKELEEIRKKLKSLE